MRAANLFKLFDFNVTFMFKMTLKFSPLFIQ